MQKYFSDCQASAVSGIASMAEETEEGAQREMEGTVCPRPIRSVLAACDVPTNSSDTVQQNTSLPATCVAQREDLMRQLVGLFPNDLTVVRRGGRWRTRLRLRTGRYISVVFSRSTRPWKDTIRCQVDPVLHEHRFVTLLVRLDINNEAIQDFHVIPNINRIGRFTLKLKDEWLDRGEHLGSLANFCEALKEVCARSKVRVKSI